MTVDDIEKFTVTVGKRQYRVELTSKGKAVRVITRIDMNGSSGPVLAHDRQVYPMQYRDLPGPTVIAVLEAAQAMQRQSASNMKETS
jgi:hypothetical protein